MLMYNTDHSWNCAVIRESMVRVADLLVDVPSALLLLVPSVKLSTVGGRAFPVGRRNHHLQQFAGSQCDLCPVSVAFLFHASFPDIIIDPHPTTTQCASGITIPQHK